MNTLSTVAYIQVLVEVRTGAYHTSESVEAINKQSAEEGVRLLTMLLKAHGGKVIGTPTCKQVTVLEVGAVK